MLKGSNILVVDDQKDIRGLLRSMLKTMGAGNVFEAASGEEAFAFLSSGSSVDRVSCILCDWNMPGMDGLSLLKKLREAGNNTAFIMVTGRTDMDSVIKAKRNGASDYVAKPFSPEDLRVKITQTLRRNLMCA